MTTARDEAWHAVLSHIDDNKSIKSTDLDLEDEKQRTALRVLRSMESMGLVTKESKQSQTWYPTDRLSGVCVKPE